MEYNTETHRLSPLCIHNHEYENTGKTLRRINDGVCQKCDNIRKRKKTLSHICLTCGIEYRTSRTQRNHKKEKWRTKYCSRECNPDFTRICKNCGKEFTARKINADFLCCSEECYNIVYHKHYVKKYRAIEMIKMDGVCRYCGKPKLKRLKHCSDMCKEKESADRKEAKKIKQQQELEYIMANGLVCKTCGIKKTYLDFHKHKASRYGILTECKDCLNKKTREYIKLPHMKEAKSKWAKKQREISPTFALNCRMSGGIRRSLRDNVSGNNNKNGNHWPNLVDFTIAELRKHLEKQFIDGMSWDNMTEWDIDHIIPVSAYNFDKPEHVDFKKCWALKNLKPMWRLDNIRKSNKIIKPVQMGLKI